MAAAEDMRTTAPVPPVCPFCRSHPASREHDCPADDMVVCRCCPDCKTINCRTRPQHPDNPGRPRHAS